MEWNIIWVDILFRTLSVCTHIWHVLWSSLLGSNYPTCPDHHFLFFKWTISLRWSVCQSVLKLETFGCATSLTPTRHKKQTIQRQLKIFFFEDCFWFELFIDFSAKGLPISCSSTPVTCITKLFRKTPGGRWRQAGTAARWVGDAPRNISKLSHPEVRRAAAPLHPIRDGPLRVRNEVITPYLYISGNGAHLVAFCSFFLLNEMQGVVLQEVRRSEPSEQSWPAGFIHHVQTGIWSFRWCCFPFAMLVLPASKFDIKKHVA